MSHTSKPEKTTPALLRPALLAGVTALLLTLGMFGYLGTFTRYRADDYCDTVNVTRQSVFISLFHRYLNISDRYSNLLFVALTERLAPHQIWIWPAVMIPLWVLALTWMIHETKRSLSLRWPFLVDLYLGSVLAFFVIWQAPDLFQIFYWRSAMATHFVPIVYLLALGAWLLQRIRRFEQQRPPTWLGAACLVLAFFGGGFSEPPAAILIVLLGMAWVAIWLWGKPPRRAAALSLIGWTLAGGLLALLVMKIAPANSLRLRTPPPDPPTLISRTLLHTLQFIQDTLIVFPLPTLLSAGVAFLLFYGLGDPRPALSPGHSRRLLVIMSLTPLVMYVLIAASFAPSIYGQSYPVARARFSGRFIMTTAILLEGACGGALLTPWKGRRQTLRTNLALALLMLFAFYPLRAVGSALNQRLSEYRQWASAWDWREAQILAQKARGQLDILVPELPGLERIKELDTDPYFWVNVCAAQFYGVRTLSAPPMGYP